MDLDCAESRCLVKNGEDYLGVPPMQSEEARSEVCYTQVKFAVRVKFDRSASEVCLRQELWKFNTKELNARVEPCRTTSSTAAGGPPSPTGKAY